MKIGSSHVQTNLLRQLALADAAKSQESQAVRDTGELSEGAKKASLIQGMIRVVTAEEDVDKMIGALSHLPLEALQRISDYGTKLEVLEKTSKNLPLYAHNLSKPNRAGAYSPTANVIFVDNDNITPRILVHEAMHALDESLGRPSAQNPWTTARDLARSTRKAIRPYATHNSAEYFADNLAASLFERESMTHILAHDIHHGIGTEGLSKTDLAKTHVHYHREGQAEVDPLGSKLCEKFWSVLPKYPKARPNPALSSDQYKQKMVERLRRKKMGLAG